MGLRPFGSTGDGRRPTPATNAPVIVTAGIARPDSAARSVESLGLRVEEILPFRDHQSYSAADLAQVLQRAGDRPIVTTAKDAVRWRAVPGFQAEGQWWIVDMQFQPREERKILERIAGAMLLGRPR
jgi:tetraacyldisaccharide 4'-kinase